VGEKENNHYGHPLSPTARLAVDEKFLFFAKSAFAPIPPLASIFPVELLPEMPSDALLFDCLAVLAVSVFSLCVFTDVGGLSPNRWPEGSISHPTISRPSIARDRPISIDLVQSSEAMVIVPNRTSAPKRKSCSFAPCGAKRTTSSKSAHPGSELCSRPMGFGVLAILRLSQSAASLQIRW
jgi:hypothetical protein